MDPIIIYFVKVNLAFTVLYLFYKTALVRDTFFGLRRLMLLLICLTSITYPFLNLNTWIPADNPFNLNVLFAKEINIPEVWIKQSSETGLTGFSIEKIFFTIYLGGVTLLSFRTLMEIINIGKLFITSSKKSLQNLHVRTLSGNDTPFSFLKWIFINPDMHSTEEINEILIHEQVHIQEKHFIDLIMIQPIIILNWFNPFVWLIRKEIRLNHEYLADRKVVLSGIDKKSYQYHLLGMKHTSMAIADLHNNFNVLPLKQRIKMLNKKRTRNIMRSRYLMFIPLLGILLLTEQQVNSTPHKTKPFVTQQEPVQPEDPILEVAEVMPEFPGGLEGLMKYLNSHIRYPNEAVNKKINGQVIIQFVIDKDGSAINAEIIKSTSKIFDDAALDVIKNMPKWTPGEQKGKKVRVKYTLPVNFKTK